MSEGLQYRIVETPTGATASIFVPGRQPVIVQSSHPAFDDIVAAARAGDPGLVAWLVNGGDTPDATEDPWLAAKGHLASRPIATCPSCSMPVALVPGDVNKATISCPFCSHEWNAFVVPDRVGAIVSWKGLTWRGGMLWSPTRSSFPWTPGVAAVAACAGRGRTAGHVAPAEGCSCGIYSGKTRMHQFRLGYVRDRDGVLAELHLSGRVVVATNGFKAQYARIGRLIVPETTQTPHIAGEIAKAWEPHGVTVTVEPIVSRSDTVRWCPGCGHPAPDDVRAVECPACGAFLERG